MALGSMPLGLRRLRHQWGRTVVLAGLTGLLTGLAVVAFERVTVEGLLSIVTRLPDPLRVMAPGVGLVVALFALKVVARGASTGTADEFVRAFHSRDGRLPLQPVAGRILASIATLGTGGALGFEGPSIYMGAVIGARLQRSFRTVFSADDVKVLMVAGAAAGVSAIFKTPATGALFALEVPYREDVAGRSALGAVVASAVAYLVFVSIQGAAPLFRISGNPGFDLKDLGGAIVLGLLCGLGAHGFALLMRWSKKIPGRRPVVGVVVGGVGLALVGWAGVAATGTPLTLGSGYAAVTYLGDPRVQTDVLVFLLIARAAATSLTLVGGGVGGLFIPLVVEGAILGRIVGALTSLPGSSLFPVVGAAAFLGAGYRTPLAAVMFVAESTGRPSFVVPALLATVAAQLLMGNASVSGYQERVRRGHVERRFDLKVGQAMEGKFTSAAPADSVGSLLTDTFIRAAARSLPVVADGRYRGVVRLEDAAAVPREEWSKISAEDLVRDVPALAPGATIGDAVATMRTERVDRVVVLAAGRIAGIVTLDAALALEDVLQARAPTEDPDPA
jgi:chloride channel protein, CIC family